MNGLNQTRKNKRTHGFSLLEVSFALAIVGVISALYYQTKLKQNEDNIMAIEAEKIKTIRNALDNYLKTYATEIVENQPISVSGYTIPAGNNPGETLSPSIENLKSLNLLAVNINEESMFRFNNGVTTINNPYTIGQIVALVDGNPTPVSVSVCQTTRCTLRLHVRTTYPTISDSRPIGTQDGTLRTSKLIASEIGENGLEVLSDELLGTVEGVNGSNQSIAEFTAQGATRGVVGALASFSYTPRSASHCQRGIWMSERIETTPTTPGTGYVSGAIAETTNCYYAYESIPIDTRVVAYDIDGTLKGKVILECKNNTLTSNLEIEEVILDASDAFKPIFDRSCK